MNNQNNNKNIKIKNQIKNHQKEKELKRKRIPQNKKTTKFQQIDESFPKQEPKYFLLRE